MAANVYFSPWTEPSQVEDSYPLFVRGTGVGWRHVHDDRLIEVVVDFFQDVVGGQVIGEHDGRRVPAKSVEGESVDDLEVEIS